MVNGNISQILLDREYIHIPSLPLCTFNGETQQSNPIRAGIFSSAPLNFKVNETTILGSASPQLSSNNYGIYAHGGGEMEVINSSISNLENGIYLIGNNASTEGLNTIKESTFSDNANNLYFKSTYKASYKLALNCNKFNYTSAAPFSKRYGIYVESGANMPSIGGTGANDEDYPSGNWWPRNASTNPQVSTWTSPTNWVSVRNGSANDWIYFGYKNEFIGVNGSSIVESNGGGTFEHDLTTSYIVSNQTNPAITNTYQGATLRKDCFNFGEVLVFPAREVVEKSEELHIRKDSSKTSYLLDPVPNPANGSTKIGFVLEQNSTQSFLEIFDIATGKIQKHIGITVGKEGTLEVGLHTLPSGIYGCRLVSDGAMVDLKRLSIVH